MSSRHEHLMANVLPRPLRNHNITINGHRTTVRLEPSLWDAFSEIGRREQIPLNELCSMVKQRLDTIEEKRQSLPDEEWEGDDNTRSVTFASAVRVFIVNYYRSLAVSELPVVTDYAQLGDALDRSIRSISARLS